MGFDSNAQEGLGVDKSTMSEFFDTLEGTLALLTGLVTIPNAEIPLEDLRKPLLVIGTPGVGKTAGIISMIKKINKRLEESDNETIKEHKLGFKKILLGQTVVGSLSGIPVVNPSTGKVTRVQMPDLPDVTKDGEYGVLFLDEITTADEAQIQPALGLCDDSRSLGEYTLPEHWLVVGAGNGPDCSNFLRLDDMTITRFGGGVFDISYNFKTDWRPWAHANNISPDIIAYLNFAPEAMARVESTEMDKAGKLSPNPRTWEALDIQLKKREALGKPVSATEMGHFASRIIGIKTAREFSAFLAFKTKMSYDADKIIAGTEVDPGLMQKEEFHIILQACIKKLQLIFKETKIDGTAHDYPEETYKKFANTVRWFLKINEIENQTNALLEMRDDIPDFGFMLMEDDLIKMVPELDDFFMNNADLLADCLNDMR